MQYLVIGQDDKTNSFDGASEVSALFREQWDRAGLELALRRLLPGEELDIDGGAATVIRLANLRREFK